MRKRASLGTRKNVPLPEGVHKRLTAYTLAAAAAGVGILAMAAPAEAESITSSSVNITVNLSNTPETLSISGSEGLVFHAGSRYVCCTIIPLRFLSVHGTGGAEFLSALGHSLAILPKGNLIGPGQPFTAANRIVAGTFSGLPQGPWNNSSGIPTAKQGYLGFKFPTNGGSDFGWAKMSCGSGGQNCHLTAFAYDTVPGQSIAAGQTSPVPEPSTLSLLALGAVGLAVLRKRRLGLASHQQSISN